MFLRFAISWWQNRVTREAQFHGRTYIPWKATRQCCLLFCGDQWFNAYDIGTVHTQKLFSREVDSSGRHKRVKCYQPSKSKLIKKHLPWYIWHFNADKTNIRMLTQFVFYGDYIVYETERMSMSSIQRQKYQSNWNEQQHCQCVQWVRQHFNRVVDHIRVDW